MSNLEEKELQILRNAVDLAEKRTGRKTVNAPEIKEIITIVENFLRSKKLICYGGTAINNILPVQDQFYDKSLEIPDYDFYSPNALKDAKELANIYYKNGFEAVEAKAGVHFGTYKVFVNYIPVADITYLNPKLFKNIFKDSIRVDGIYYCAPNYLRMSMFLELSRPMGDVSRWEKVLKRLMIMDKHYPLKSKYCNNIDFQRPMDSKDIEEENIIYKTVKKTFIDQGVVFFGGFAHMLYSQYMPKNLRKKLKNIPDFDVLAEEPYKTAVMVKERLGYEDIKKVKIIKHEGLGEVIATHYEIRVEKDTLAFIYEPLACHSYNLITINNMKIKIATIDTMLSFYLAFLYSNRPYYDTERILCMSQFLFTVQQKNRLQQKGLLKRFSINCYGHQETLDAIREHKSKKFEELKTKRNSKEFESWFLNYKPGEKKETVSNKTKTRTNTKTIKRSKKNKTKKKQKN
jgi:hypothetical protein